MKRPDSDSTDGLWARARRGDSAALGLLVERHRETLLERIRWMLGDEARRRLESVDLLQGVFTELVARAAELDLADEHALLRWMTAVARNDIRDEACRRRERALASLSGSFCAESPGRSPASEAGRNEELLGLIEALECLSADHRRVIELRDLEGLAFEEVGRAMARSAAAAQMLHARAKLRLGRVLGEKGEV